MGVQRLARLQCRAGGAQFCCNIAATRVNHGAIKSWGEFNAEMQGFPVSFSLKGFSKIEYILPKRLPALVRPAKNSKSKTRVWLQNNNSKKGPCFLFFVFFLTLQRLACLKATWSQIASGVKILQPHACALCRTR